MEPTQSEQQIEQILQNKQILIESPGLQPKPPIIHRINPA
jgi:hypothetical protein